MARTEHVGDHDGRRSESLRKLLAHPLVVTVAGAVATTIVPYLLHRPTWSLAVIGAAILVCGAALLIQDHRNPRHAWCFVMAIVAIIVGGGWVGAISQTWIRSRPPGARARPVSSRAASPSPSAESRVGLPVARNGVQVGDCFNDHKVYGSVYDILPYSMTVVPCASAHDIEAYFVGDPWRHGQPFPGEKSVVEQADDLCKGKAFADYVGIRYVYSILGYVDWFPDAEQWSDGDQRLVCFAYLPDKPLNYSVRGLQG